ncbi:hypothetical protein Dimus_008074 [Dionaea muscipula]
MVSLDPHFPSSDLLIFVVDFVDFLGFRVGVYLGVDLAAGGGVVALAWSGEVLGVAVGCVVGLRATSNVGEPPWQLLQPLGGGFGGGQLVFWVVWVAAVGVC